MGPGKDTHGTLGPLRPVGGPINAPQDKVTHNDGALKRDNRQVFRQTEIEKKIFDIDKNMKARVKKAKESMLTGIRFKAVRTGFHNETSEPEVIQLLRESKAEIGMTMENVRIEWTSKPITHAVIHFKNDEERNKFVRSANMLKKSNEEGS